MPKGTFGCWQCGEPTEVAVQVWLRDYTEGFYASARGAAVANRRMTSVSSVMRNLCREHGLLLYERCATELSGSSYRGCSICGDSPTFSRIQVWARTTEPSRTIKALSRGYCEGHSIDVYDAVSMILDADSVQPTGQRGGTMAGARAARGAA